MSSPLAYFLTWTTYGTWLPGDERGRVDAKNSGIQAPDVKLQKEARGRMTQEALTLNAEQRAVAAATIRAHCDIRRWSLHALNVRTNHVHVVITAPILPEEVMRQLKAWWARRLSEQKGLSKNYSKDGAQRWWTEGGSTKWINDETYLHNAIRYVLELQG